MLSVDPAVNYIYEPFNYDRRPRRWKRLGAAGRLYGRHQYLHVDEAAYRRIASPLRRSVRRWAGRDAAATIIKDPTAVFLAPALDDLCDARVVMMVRHPIGVAASRTDLNWRFNFRHFLDQPSLMDRLTPTARRAIAQAVRAPGDPVIESAAMWCTVYTVVNAWLAERPAWRVVRHEDICDDPEGMIGRLYGELGLPCSDAVRQTIAEETRAKGPAGAPAQHNHKRDSRSIPQAAQAKLSNEQIDTVYALCGEVAARFYDAASWGDRVRRTSPAVA